MEYTKTALVKAIHELTNYTYKEINDKYEQELNKHPSRNKYYARKHAIKVLQGWLNNLRNNTKWCS